MKNGSGILSFIVIFCLLLSRCTGSRNAGQNLPFKDIEWKLVKGKLKDSIIWFNEAPSQSFIVKFYGNKFRKFDGRFNIRGTSTDTNSVYYTSIPYAGFYNVEADSAMRTYWFDKISWSMDFNKHRMGKIIQELFHFNGKYSFSKDVLVFFNRYGGRGNDTLIILKSR